MTLLSEIYDVVHSNRDCCSPRATLAQNFMTNHDYNCDGQAPTANFTADVAAGNTPLPVQFINTSTGEITSHLWTFGDGTTSTEENPSHIYTTLGDHTVSLTVTGPTGSDTITRTDYIGVVIPPAAEFVADKTAGVGTLDVQFTDQSTGIILYYDWDFGDGTVASGERSVGSYEQNPMHTFTAPGSYTVKLKVTGSGTGDIDEVVKVDYIKINVDPPVANFISDKTGGNQPLTVQFTGHTEGTITSHLWNFGDGQTSTELSPSHTYVSNGSYTVSFTATGPGGSDVETKTNYITVAVAPVAQFISDNRYGAIPTTINFTSTSTGTITKYLWNFGDGTISTVQNPSHIYTSVGTYPVSLTITGPGGQDTETKTDFIITTTPVSGITKNISTPDMSYAMSVLKDNGELYGWGDNTYNKISPTAIIGTSYVIKSGVKSFSSSSFRTLVVMENGDLHGWGYVSFMCPVFPGAHDTLFKDASLVLATNVKQVSTSDYGTIILKENGDVCAWGPGTTGVPNDNFTVILSGVKQVATGTGNDAYFMALKENGDLHGFGSNNYSTIDPGPGYVDKNTVIMTGVKQVACGTYHTVVLKENGEVYSWGYNNYAQADPINGGTWGLNKTIPVLTGAKQVDAGHQSTVVLMENGDLHGWGNNNEGRLDPAVVSSVIVDVDHVIYSGVTEVSTGYDQTIVVMENGDLHGWGNNYYYNIEPNIGNVGSNNFTDKDHVIFTI